jgi:Tol biopolymer transport system component
VRKAVEAAVQMARGLAAAHDKGLVHRDLKPENVFLTHDGQVKILDFGLSKAAATGSGATKTAIALTDPGAVMGTVGYMAPEQVRGTPVDARADLFALGAVLYEMLTGRRAFQRDTAVETMTAVLREDPPELSGAHAALSPALDRTVRHCLEKDPSERFQAARDVVFALESLADAVGSASGGVSPPAVAATHHRWKAGRVVAAWLLVAAFVALAFWAGQRWPARQPLTAPPTFTRLTFDRQSIANARLMPDGREAVFSVILPDGSASLYTVRPGAAAPQPVGQPRTHLLAISKNRELLVLTEASWLNQRLFAGTLARMPVDGAPIPLQDHVREADWAPNGEDLAIVRDADGQDRLEYPVGTVLYETPGYVSNIRISPDGSRVAFMDHQVRYDNRGFVKVVDRSREVTTLAGEYTGEDGLAWTPDGSTVVFSAFALGTDNLSQILAVRIDSPGQPFVVLSGAGSQWILDIARGQQNSWLISGNAGFDAIMVLAPGQSREQEFLWHHAEWNPSLSSDGRQLMFTDGSAGANYGVAVRQVDDRRVRKLGEGDAHGFSPDNQWALAVIVSQSRLVAYRIGVGSPRQLELDTGRLEHFGGPESLSWYPESSAV